MAKRKLTSRQEEVLLFIRDFTEVNGFAPTTMEIAEAISTSLRPAQKHVERLYVKGFINKLHGKPRGIVVLNNE